MCAGMIPTLHRPGEMIPGQFGPMRRVLLLGSALVVLASLGGGFYCYFHSISQAEAAQKKEQALPAMTNTIGMLESREEIWAKLRPAVTDPARIRKTDPGTPEVCNIYHLHKALSPPATVEHVAAQCMSAGWGCIDCKKVLAESMETELVPIRSRAEALREEPARVRMALAAGADKCRALARDTMRGVRERMGFDG